MYVIYLTCANLLGSDFDMLLIISAIHFYLHMSFIFRIFVLRFFYNEKNESD